MLLCFSHIVIVDILEKIITHKIYHVFNESSIH